MNWKKILLGLVGLFVAFVAVLFFGGMMMDGTVALETEATLDAPPEVVHRLMADPTGVIKWWTGAAEELGSEAMSGMTIEQGEGPAAGPGATVLFKLGDTLAEEWTLVSVDAPNEVVWDVDFQMFVVRRTLQLKADGGDKTSMRWADIGTFENPFMRWFTLMPAEGVLQNFQNAMKLMNKKAMADLGALQAQTAADQAAAKAAAEAGDDDSAAAP
jgi:hypothetical protein